MAEEFMCVRLLLLTAQKYFQKLSKVLEDGGAVPGGLEGG